MDGGERRMNPVAITIINVQQQNVIFATISMLLNVIINMYS